MVFIYATEYWLEDLLCSNAAIGGCKTTALLCSTAKALADRLNAASHSAGISTEQELDKLDDRLKTFANQGAVYDMLQSALIERSAKANSTQARHESCKCHIKDQGFIINLIFFYFRLQFLLISRIPYHPGISKTC